MRRIIRRQPRREDRAENKDHDQHRAHSSERIVAGEARERDGVSGHYVRCLLYVTHTVTADKLLPENGRSGKDSRATNDDQPAPQGQV